MSRVAQTKSSPVAKSNGARPGGGSGDAAQDGEHLSLRMKQISLDHRHDHDHNHTHNLHRGPLTDNMASEEICPVCKSSRYLNASLRFLVNPACYHKMCESCVDRLFSHGPQSCPIPGCKETLRKNRFRKQTFEDIQVEREVDIRRKVAAVFNRREDEFETIRDYNDYLNDVEDITFNLINKIDLEDTERRFEQYEKAHQAEIAENASLAQQETMSYSKLQKAEREQAKQRREAARREEADERQEQQASKRDMLRRLESGQDPGQVAKASEGQGVMLKKRLNRQDAAARQQQLQAADARNGSSNLIIKGLKAKVKAEPEAPVDPFGGLSFEGMKYYSVQERYVWDMLESAERDSKVTSGGYEVASFTQRALCEAFSGLGCFVADAATESEKSGQDDQAMGTMSAELMSAQDVKMEDPSG
ncbi:hypothetical protein AC579_6384 [Pseudocercospora musae]|uniref:RNA polymerase II transcription factor B subunit 3 n=1 Tax=Pseudocercospora musae TaxID=113226 RepID=A0A139IIY3_9PEZI|nr:hypothetical protein AC579_6384 [Pseudocercospora musae]